LIYKLKLYQNLIKSYKILNLYLNVIPFYLKNNFGLVGKKFKSPDKGHRFKSKLGLIKFLKLKNKKNGQKIEKKNFFTNCFWVEEFSAKTLSLVEGPKWVETPSV
jgi:hypothetical protein